MDPIVILSIVLQHGNVSVESIGRLFRASRKLNIDLLEPRSLKLNYRQSCALYLLRNEDFAAVFLSHYIHSLDFFYLPELTDGPSEMDPRHYYLPLTDVSLLGNVHTLDLSHTYVTNVSSLSNVHTLYLWGTPVKDVSVLSNVHELDLRRTPVTDISTLDNVAILTLPSGETRRK